MNIARSCQQLGDCDELVAVQAGTAWPKAAAEGIAIGTALLGQVAGAAPVALVDDLAVAGGFEAASGECSLVTIMGTPAAEGDHLAGLAAVPALAGSEKRSPTDLTLACGQRVEHLSHYGNHHGTGSRGGVPPLASRSRKEGPSKTTTSQWWRRRSRMAVALVASGRKLVQSSKAQFEVSTRLRVS